MKSWFVASIVLLLFGCQSVPKSTVPKQGISGQVYWLESDFMPAIGQPPSGSKMPVIRELLFYPIIQSSELKKNSGPIYETLPGVPVGKTNSNELGQFSIELPVGIYSIFTKEPGGYYANSFDGDGFINPVEVNAGIFSEITIEINYKAVF